MADVADKTSIVYESLNTSGVKKQRSITNVNPQASGADMRQLAQGFNSLSNNTWVGARRVDTTDLANAVAKQTPTFTVNPVQIISSAAGSTVTLAYNGDADKFIFPIPNAQGNVIRRVNVSDLAPVSGNTGQWTVKLSTTGTGVDGNFIIQVPETNNYYAAEVSVKIIAQD